MFLCHQGESKGSVNTNILYLALWSIHITGGQRSARVAPCFLTTVVHQPETSSV